MLLMFKRHYLVLSLALYLASLFLDAVQARPEWQTHWHDWWRTFVGSVDATPLLADYGFAPRTAFLSELAHRLRRKVLPGTPETTDLAELFGLLLPTRFDVLWLKALDTAVHAYRDLEAGTQGGFDPADLEGMYRPWRPRPPRPRGLPGRAEPGSADLRVREPDIPYRVPAPPPRGTSRAAPAPFAAVSFKQVHFCDIVGSLRDF